MRKKDCHLCQKMERGYQKFVEYKVLVEEYEDIDDVMAKELFLQRISNGI